MGEVYKVTGTVKRIALEGGFWAIEGDDGQKYCPLDLPRDFQRDGARVRARLAPADVMSARMWGIDVEVREIKALDA